VSRHWRRQGARSDADGSYDVALWAAVTNDGSLYVGPLKPPVNVRDDWVLRFLRPSLLLGRPAGEVHTAFFFHHRTSTTE
jgi:hypothetical protein